MSEQVSEPSPVERALKILGETYQNATRIKAERYQAERDAADRLQAFHLLTGQAAVDLYMKQHAPDGQAIERGIGALASAGIAWVKAEALRSGVTHQLPKVLQEADAAIADLIGGQRLHAQAAPGILSQEAINLRTPGGIRYYGIPTEGVSGTFVRSDAESGQLFLSHPDKGVTWAINLFQAADTLEPKAIISPLLAEQ